MIETIERIAEYLYGYRKLYYALWVIAYVVLGIFAMRGYEVTFAFVLTFLWLAGFGFSVSTLRRTARIEEAQRHRSVAPEIVSKFVTSRAYDYFALVFAIFWFSFLAYVTYRLTAA